ncbi:hypothetical protein LWF15_20100 [Kineosporia rhizophila]|uniref:hypothetical protein n=1 Tax=Kineosporia TaxID=49184 RepID=UPI000A8BDD51|nr:MULTISPECIES: hypothetical protein [Kineosporia]MCE0537800.1 hypothetical protein [Kineosporia rhizophila]GLY15788.1 hypothetical protein Kisp01_28030 [Kineosporia sp. NBRC 101677]
MSEDAKNYLRRIVGMDNVPGVRIADLGLQNAVNYSFSAFHLALSKRFEDGATTTELQDFVRRARGAWIKPEALNPVLAEKVLLDAMGNDGLVDDVPIPELTDTQNLLTYALVNDLKITGDALEQFVEDALRQLEEMEDED